MLGNIIGAIGSIAGGFLGNKAQEKANRQNLKWAKDQAQNRIKWTVQDAKRSGIHPLAALGANVPTTSPGIVGATSFGDGVAAGAAQLGNAFNKSEAQELENLQKDLIRSQIRQSDSVTSVNVARSRSILGAMRSGATNVDGVKATLPAKDFTSAMVMGHRVDPAFTMSDAQVLEDRYGEAISIPAGVAIAASDLWKGYRNGPENRISDRMRKDRRANPGKYNWQEDY